MTESTVRCVLRLIAVVTILIGVRDEATTMFSLAVGGPPDARVLLMLLPPLVTVAIGLALFATSTALAHRILRN
jgi:hypothetical protein